MTTLFGHGACWSKHAHVSSSSGCSPFEHADAMWQGVCMMTAACCACKWGRYHTCTCTHSQSACIVLQWLQDSRHTADPRCKVQAQVQWCIVLQQGRCTFGMLQRVIRSFWLMQKALLTSAASIYLHHANIRETYILSSWSPDDCLWTLSWSTFLQWSAFHPNMDKCNRQAHLPSAFRQYSAPKKQHNASQNGPPRPSEAHALSCLPASACCIVGRCAKVVRHAIVLQSLLMGT